LAQHGVAMTPESAQRLKETEFERARELQSRKFGHPPSTAAEHAKQSRFLAGRGFSTDTIRLVMRLVGWASIPEEVADSDED
jgi:regulatory protein